MRANFGKAICVILSGAIFLTAGGAQTAAAGTLSAGIGNLLDLSAIDINTEKQTVENISLVAGMSELLENVVDEAVATVSASDTESVRSAAGEDLLASFGYKNVGIAVVEEGNLNVREAASTDSKMVGKMPNNSACEVIGEEDGWYQITSGEVSGYVCADFLVTGPEAVILAESVKQTVARSNTMTLNVREEPNTECSIITTMAEGETVEVIEELDGWIKVAVDSDEGYVCADYVEVVTELPHAMTMTEARYGVGVSDVRVALVDYALQFVGNPYVWGGTSLTRGADCSGFVLSIYAKYGYSLPHSSRAQAGYGTKISASEAKPGDLFFYGRGKSINHVAIYIGGGQIVHASSKKTGIKVSNCRYRTPIKVVNILGN